MLFSDLVRNLGSLNLTSLGSNLLHPLGIAFAIRLGNFAQIVPGLLGFRQLAQLVASFMWKAFLNYYD